MRMSRFTGLGTWSAARWQVARRRAVVLLPLVLGAAVLLMVIPAGSSPAAAATAGYAQGSLFDTGSPVTSVTVTLTQPVSAGDLLVGWFAQYNSAGQVNVSDPVNGTWTRAPDSVKFSSGTGDIALYYVANAKASSGALAITVSASSATYLEGAVAEYSGVATTTPLLQISAATGKGTVVSSGSTPAVAAGQLVYAAELTGTNPGSATPGSSAGLAYTARAKTSSGDVMEEDVTASAAGAQQGTATFTTSADWYAVVAAFQVGGASPSPTPTPTTTGTPTPTTSPTPTPTTTGTPTPTTSPTPTPTTTGTPTPTTSPTPTPTTTGTPTPTTSPTPTQTPTQTPTPTPTPTPTGSSPPPPSQIAYVQGNSFSTAPLTSTTVSLSQPVHAGDLLVGWFAQYGAPGQVQVSDNVNGTWTRAPGSLAYQNDGGDIALYYLTGAAASGSGVKITVSASAATYLDGTVAEYSGVAAAGALDQTVAARGVGTSVSTGSTPAVAAGDLVYMAMVTGQPAGTVTPGSSQGTAYATRISANSGSVDEFDITSAQAGAQQGTATASTSTDWYAVTATFHPLPVNASPPSAPAGLSATSVAASRVALHWSASTGSVTGYTVLRNGAPLGTTSGTSYLDMSAAPSSTYTYTVVAFNGAGQQSAPSGPAQVQTPASSPAFVQGIADSPGSKATSLTLTLSKPVAAGDLLVGWFGEFNAAGQVQVSDNVNGAWTRSSAETFNGGTGDIALYYLANSKAAPGGLTVTISASAPAYLQESIADYSGVATTAPLDQAVVNSGTGSQVTGGSTASVPAGELLIAGLITGGQPGTIAPGASQNVPLAVNVQNGSASADMEDILSTAPGAQTAGAALGVGSDWYMVVATFRPLGS